MSEQWEAIKAKREEQVGESTYFIDADNFGEVARLCKQHRLLANGMGGALPEISDFSYIQDVLDIACGAGGWVVDIALEHPTVQVTGVDINPGMLEYARSQAQEEDVQNLHLHLMDATGPLDFSDNTFDLVNARLLSSFMPTSKWPTFLRECARITRPGGAIRVVEAEAPLTNSAACEQLNALIAQSMKVGGLGFSPDGRHVGLIPVMKRLLQDAGCHNVRLFSYAIDCSASSLERVRAYQNGQTVYKLVQPYLLQLGLATQQELDRLYHLALEDMNSPDFCALWTFVTVLGEVPDPNKA
ncbi:class I SAM-dependent methyltransferase [Ktedonobacter robiniae]|uniref:Methyltransferase domain-containing protein n=1 Tax=Ktedonobacter robiniae TaxID=2778365 RepID=A0ABQ3V4A5_9CHLR|nr:class I SAM-dependent methyltransferase [Ktedonobacter robiniae]GHO59305.1 hypothetical protein KSB_77800 [Ktedonobacter robiniae]